MVQRTKRILNPLFDGVRSGGGVSSINAGENPVGLSSEYRLVYSPSEFHETFAFAFDANENVNTVDSADGTLVNDWSASAGTNTVLGHTATENRPLLYAGTPGLFNGSNYVVFNWNKSGSGNARGSFLNTQCGSLDYGFLSWSRGNPIEHPGSGMTIIAVLVPLQGGRASRYLSLIYQSLQNSDNGEADFSLVHKNVGGEGVSDYFGWRRPPSSPIWGGPPMTSSNPEVVAFTRAFNLSGSQDLAGMVPAGGDGSVFVSGFAPFSGSGTDTVGTVSGSWGHLQVASWSSVAGDFWQWGLAYMEAYHSRLAIETIQDRIAVLADRYDVTLRS